MGLHSRWRRWHGGATALTYSQVVLSDNPDGFWRLTTLADTSGHGLTLTLAGPPVVVPSLIAREPSDKAYQFTNVNTHGLTHAQDPLLNSSLNYSIEAWVTIDNVHQWQAVGKASHYNIGSDSSNHVFGTIFSSGGFFDLTGTTVMTVSTGIYHVVLTRASNVGRLYVNGVQEATRSDIPATVATATGNFAIGANPGFFNGWFGKIDEVAIYHTTLSPARVAAHYAAGT